MDETFDYKEAHRLQLKHSLIFPLFFVFLIWFIKVVEFAFDLNLVPYGVLPRTTKGISGILTSPLVHKDFSHLFANTSPVFVLSWGLFYFYRGISYSVFLWLYLCSGLLLWIVGSPAYHIGASGVVYALAAFLFLSGLLRMHIRLIAISFIVVFLYGSLFWGIFPIMKGVSWDGHLSGAIIGFLLAYLYRKKGMQAPPPLSDDDDESIPEEIWNSENLKQSATTDATDLPH